jgi:hypothetical protein
MKFRATIQANLIFNVEADTPENAAKAAAFIAAGWCDGLWVQTGQGEGREAKIIPLDSQPLVEAVRAH